MISISDTISQVCPNLRLGCIQSQVVVSTQDTDLWDYLTPRLNKLAQKLQIEDIRHIPTIAATREGYKATGKDPARYRPSAEALTRRVVSGKGLYQVNNVVDLLNFVSVSFGFSIGGYDVDKIEGDIVLGIGQENEPYQAIGRGELNIAGLPLFRDDLGAFGSPTSDSQRTMVRPETNQFLMVFFSFHPNDPLQEAMNLGKELLINFAQAVNVEEWVVGENSEK